MLLWYLLIKVLLSFAAHCLRITYSVTDLESTVFASPLTSSSRDMRRLWSSTELPVCRASIMLIGPDGFLAWSQKIMKSLWRERQRERERKGYHKKQRINNIDSLQYITFFENQLLYDNLLNQSCYRDTYMFINRWLLHRKFWQGLSLRVDSLQSHAPPLGGLRRFWCLHSGWFNIITLI